MVLAIVFVGGYRMGPTRWAHAAAAQGSMFVLSVFRFDDRFCCRHGSVGRTVANRRCGVGGVAVWLTVMEVSLFAVVAGVADVLDIQATVVVAG